MSFPVNKNPDQFIVFDEYPATFHQTDMDINFEEIAKLAEDFPEHNNLKLMEDNGVSVSLPAAAVAEIAQPDGLYPNRQLTPRLQPKLLPLESASPDNCFLQPFPLETSGKSSKLINSIQSLTLDNNGLQPAAPESSSVQPVRLVQHYSVAACYQQQSIPKSLALCSVPQSSVGPPLSSCPVQHQEEAAPVKSTGNTDVALKKRRARKTKVYEMDPLEDEKEEKKRLNAINAKKHRDKQKEERANLAKELQKVTAERDNLLQLVQQLKQSEAQLRQMLANQEH